MCRGASEKLLGLSNVVHGISFLQHEQYVKWAGLTLSTPETLNGVLETDHIFLFLKILTADLVSLFLD